MEAIIVIGKAEEIAALALEIQKRQTENNFANVKQPQELKPGSIVREFS